MLIEFSVRNFLSIKEEITFSMMASNAVKELENSTDWGNNVFWDEGKKTKYLKTAVIYGANGSGKSNLLSAIAFYRKFILSSSNNSQADDEIKTIPFLLSTETGYAPSSFEMVFIINSVRFRYGFEVTKEAVTAEWLFGLNTEKSNKESAYFTREKQIIKVYGKNFKEGKGLETRTRPNALFLSTVAQLNGAISHTIQSWLKNNINILSGLEDTTKGYTIGKFINHKEFAKKTIAFFRLLGLGIEDIQIEKQNSNHAPNSISKKQTGKTVAPFLQVLEKKLKDEMKKTGHYIEEAKTLFWHTKFDKANKPIGNIPLSLGLESKGTQKIFNLLGPWFDTIENGGVLIVDELDSRLHTKLTTELLKLFHTSINTKNAQLIFASHDTNLLRKDLLRRDQIWFTEKNSMGATDLYSLVEYKINQATSVRNDASFEKDYLIGKYGAIPYFGDIPKFLNDFVHEQ